MINIIENKTSIHAGPTKLFTVLTMLLDVASAQIVVEVMQTGLPLRFGLHHILWY